jgi:uncharacterized glyoxalase superfamily protein PhnB
MWHKRIKIGTHIYVRGSAEAVELYKKAFGLELENEPKLDSDGLFIHGVLQKNGTEYLSISEDKYLPEALLKEYPSKVKPIMLFEVEFENEDDLRKAYELLSKDGNPCAGLKDEPWSKLSCDVIDKYGVFWYLIVWK